METQAVMYHHDAITGTHTPETLQGYMRMMRKQYRKNFRHLSRLMTTNAENQGLILEKGKFRHCHLQFDETYEDIERPVFSLST